MTLSRRCMRPVRTHSSHRLPYVRARRAAVCRFVSLFYDELPVLSAVRALSWAVVDDIPYAFDVYRFAEILLLLFGCRQSEAVVVP